MKVITRFGAQISLGLWIAGVAAACVVSPNDETVLASRTTPVSFSGFTTSDVGEADDASTAARAFYVFAWEPAQRRQVALSAAAYPNENPVKHGNYDWHSVGFGELVIPTWAWDSEPTRWHARLRIAVSSELLAWTLYSFTSDELGCYIEAIGAGGNVVGAAIDCGGDWDIDLYVNK